MSKSKKYSNFYFICNTVLIENEWKRLRYRNIVEAMMSDGTNAKESEMNSEYS